MARRTTVISCAQVISSVACWGIDEAARSLSGSDSQSSRTAFVYSQTNLTARTSSPPSSAERSSTEILCSACDIGVVAGGVLEKPLQEGVLLLQRSDECVRCSHLRLQGSLELGNLRLIVIDLRLIRVHLVLERLRLASDHASGRIGDAAQSVSRVLEEPAGGRTTQKSQ